MTSSRHVWPSSTVGVAVIGYGYWGPNLVRNFASTEGVRVVSVSDLDAEKLALVRRRHADVGVTTDFRDPVIWTVLRLIGSTIVDIILFILLDGDLVKHDLAEGAVEAELSEIYGRLGAPVPPPDPSRIKGKHNYVARFIVLFVTGFIYGLWWQKNLMDEPNRHFQHNWAWEDHLAQAVQSL